MNDRQRKGILCPRWQNEWLKFEANHPPHMQSQIDLIAIPLRYPLRALRVVQSRFSTSFSTSNDFTITAE